MGDVFSGLLDCVDPSANKDVNGVDEKDSSAKKAVNGVDVKELFADPESDSAVIRPEGRAWSRQWSKTSLDSVLKKRCSLGWLFPLETSEYIRPMCEKRCGSFFSFCSPECFCCGKLYTDEAIKCDCLYWGQTATGSVFPQLAKVRDKMVHPAKCCFSWLRGILERRSVQNMLLRVNLTEAADHSRELCLFSQNTMKRFAYATQIFALLIVARDLFQGWRRCDHNQITLALSQGFCTTVDYIFLMHKPSTVIYVLWFVISLAISYAVNVFVRGRCNNCYECTQTQKRCSEEKREDCVSRCCLCR